MSNVISSTCHRSRNHCWRLPPKNQTIIRKYRSVSYKHFAVDINLIKFFSFSAIWKNSESNNARYFCNTNVPSTDLSHVSIGIFIIKDEEDLCVKETAHLIIALTITAPNTMRRLVFARMAMSESFEFLTIEFPFITILLRTIRDIHKMSRWFSSTIL